MKKQVRWALWGIAAIISVMFAALWASRPLEAELLEVTPRPIVKGFVETGTVVPVENKEIYSAVAGRVEKVYVAEGDSVQAGELLLSLDTREIRYQLEQLAGHLASVRGQERQAFLELSAAQEASQKLAIEQARLQLEASQNEYARAAALYEAGAVGRAYLEEAARAVALAEKMVEQQELALVLLLEQSRTPAGTREHFAGLADSIRAQMALLEEQLKNAVVRAPIDGTIQAVHLKEGAVVAPGSPLFTIFQGGPFEVELFLLAGDVPAVTQGMETTVSTGDGRGKLAWRGHVSGIAPAAVQTVSALGVPERRVRVTVRIEGDTSVLRPGYELDVHFTTHREEDRLVVPRSALFPYNGGRAVWVVSEGRAAIRAVETGLENDDEVVVLQGLTAGDVVIRNPRLDNLKQGIKIKGRLQ